MTRVLQDPEVRWAQRTARAIGESLAHQGRSELQPWIRVYADWKSCTAILGREEALSFARGGMQNYFHHQRQEVQS